ncbi:MAG: peptidase, partial [Burkholderiaceae bacterium]|nr:peptidase [Burkholderiaceae bacterium]
MDFFEQQELARRASRRLLALFALAVVAVVVAVNVAGALLYLWATGGIGGSLPRGFYATNTVIVLALIGGGTLWEIQRLSAGGEVVAQMIGARPVDPGTRDLLERRLLNVVEEMALASGVA